MAAPPSFSAFQTILDFSQWELAIQAFFCDPVQGGGLFVLPAANTDSTRESWAPPTGCLAFYTGFQSQIFQMARPRLSLAPINYSEMEDVRIMDATGRLFRQGWRVPLEFYLVTKNDYLYHTQTLALCRAIIQFMNPTQVSPADGSVAFGNIQTTGLNAFLTSHELAQVRDSGGPTFGGKSTLDEGFFVSPLRYNAIFAVQASQWPNGTLNT